MASYIKIFKLKFGHQGPFLNTTYNNHARSSLQKYLLPQSSSSLCREIAGIAKGYNMATKELPFSVEYMHDEEAPAICVGQKKGGWITFPFVTVSLMGLTIAAAGWMTNLIVYLIQKFNIKNIHATEISNVVSGCTCFFPIVGAIIADSFVGNFFVILVSSILSLL
ncbi:NRT1/ PTR FAMILY 2.7-like, partial [Thalictrum thalictroides]